MNPLDELSALLKLFPGPQTWIQSAVHVPSGETPEPYKSLLVHDHHMTVAMESYHQTSVTVEVLDRQQIGSIYARKILLRKQGTDEVVQSGIVRFDLSTVTDPVAEAILAEQEPLGRILILHNVLRHIDLGAILRITPGPELCARFRCEPQATTYGRLATIFCNHRPAVDLLEISAPLRATGGGA